MIYRTKWITAFSLILLPLIIFAQESIELTRIVVLGPSVPADQMQAFEQGLLDLGHINGSTISIEYYSAQGDENLLAALAQQVVVLKPKVIAAIGAKAGRAIHNVTQDIPIIVVTGDMISTGLVANLARPEGNVTGLSFFNIDLRLKQFEILLELAPRLRRLNVLVSGQLNPTLMKALEALTSAAEQRDIDIHIVRIDRIENVKTELEKLPATAEEGVFVSASPVFDAHPEEIGRLTAEYRHIAMLPWKRYVQAGGLVSYSPDIIAIWYRASSYVDRILRGAKPSDLPVEQPREFELVINLETAKTLGLTVPMTLLLRADEVIE